MKISKLIGRILGKSFKILGIIFLITLGTYWMIRTIGKAELYLSAAGKAPVLNTELVDGVEPAGEGYDRDVILYRGEPYRYNKDILTFLVMGVDSLEPVPEPDEVTDYTLGGQADTLFLLVINPHIKEIQVIAINRNTMTEIDVYDSNNNYVRTDLLQACLQHGYGSGREDSCERQVKAISTLFYNLPIHGYIAMNMAAVHILNDCVGGVTLEVMENIPWGTDVIAQGQGNIVTLEGMDAYYYLQYRDVEVFDSATARFARQKQYLNAFTHQAIAMTKQDITFPLTVYDGVSDYTVTNINPAQITYLTSEYIGYSFNLDGIYSLEGETIIGGGGFEEFYADDEALYDLMIKIFFEKVDK